MAASFVVGYFWSYQAGQEDTMNIHNDNDDSLKLHGNEKNYDGHDNFADHG
jgi:hypothetical protein